MKRCRHEHALLTEETVTLIEFDILRGEIISDNASLSSPTGHYEINCLDCGYGRRFSASATFGLPRWIQKAYDARRSAA